MCTSVILCVYIEPSSLNFGNTVVESPVKKDISIKNCTLYHVSINIEVS